MDISAPNVCKFFVKRSDLITSEMISGYKRFPDNEHFCFLNLQLEHKYSNKYIKIKRNTATT